MKKNALIRKLFTTTLLSSFAIINTEINAAPITYNNAYSYWTIITDPLPNERITINGAKNLLFKGVINAQTTINTGIYIGNKSIVTFDNKVTSIINYGSGIHNENSSTTIFNKVVFLEKNDTYGINNIQSSKITFNDKVTANNNGYSIYNNSSKAVFNGDVEANFNTVGIMSNATSNVAFNGKVTVNNNGYGIYTLVSSTAIFQGDVSANFNDDGIITITNSNITFNGKVISNNNVYRGAYNRSSTSHFNNNVTTNNNDLGIYNYSFSNITFEGNVVANDNNMGINNKLSSTALFKGDVTANFNNTFGIENSDSSNITFEGDVSACNNTNGGIKSINDSSITFNGNVTATGNGGSNDFMVGSTSSLIFKNDKIITGNFRGNSGTAGTLTFVDGPTIMNSIDFTGTTGGLVQFTSTDPLKRASLNADIISLDIELYGLQIGIDNPVTMKGSLKTYGTIFDLSNAPLTISGPITDGNGNGVTLTGTNPLILPSNYAVNIGIKPINDEIDGVVVFTDDPIVNQELGNISHNLKSVSFTSNDPSKRTSLKKAIYTGKLEFDQLTVGVDSDLILKGPIITNNTIFDLSKNLSIDNKLTNLDPNGTITLKGTGTLTFNFDNAIDAAIVPDINETGNIVFTGGPTINKQLGTALKRLESVKFNSNDPNTRITLNNNIYTKQNTIEFGKQIVEPGTDIILIGNVKTDNTIFNLTDKIITIEGKLTHNDLSGGLIVSTNYNGTTAGHFELTGIAGVDLTNSANITFTVTETPGTPLPTAGVPRRINMFNHSKSPTFIADISKVIINTSTNPSDKFVKWSFDPATGDLIEELIMLPAVIVGGGGGSGKTGGTPVIVPETVTKNIEVIIKTNPELTENLANLYIDEGEPALKEAFDRLEIVAIGNPAENLALVPEVVSSRVTNLSGSKDLAFNDEMGGISAGETIDKFGAWFSPFYGQNIQKMRKNAPGYKSIYYGGVFGFDSAINNSTTLGIAFSTITTKIKHSDQNIGDKTNINTNIVHVYGSYELSDQWFVQNVTTAGTSRIKNRELRKEFKQYNIASANYKANFVSTELITGFNHKIKYGLILTPTIGLNYSKSGKISYRECGTQFQNLMVKVNGTQQLEAITGVSLEGIHQFKNGLKIHPEIHGDIGYLLLNQKPNVDIRQELHPEVKLASKNIKSAKFIYSIGGSISNISQNQKWDYSFGYDCKLSDKFIAHQGTLKLRVNF